MSSFEKFIKNLENLNNVELINLDFKNQRLHAA